MDYDGPAIAMTERRPDERHLETLLAQIGNRSDTATGTVSAPIYLSTAFRHHGLGRSTGYDYTRSGNPTRDLLEAAIAELEGGCRGFACSSGMAAIQTVMGLFEHGDDIIASLDLYGGSYRLFEGAWRKWGLTFQYVDTTRVEALQAAIKHNTKAVFLETPTNPLLQETDLAAVAALCREHNLLLIVDNTFYTPLLQRPLLEGADIVVHSATKYLGGHNDVLAGLIVAKDEALAERLYWCQNSAGAVLSAFDSWLLMRGMKTLALRLERHQSNAQALAAYLREHPAVSEVLYPGRGGMLSFRLREAAWVAPFLETLRLICFAESLGGVESFITFPATQTHADVPEDERLRRGIDDRLLRFSVGIEHVDDLIADLEQALAAAQQ